MEVKVTTSNKVTQKCPNATVDINTYTTVSYHKVRKVSMYKPGELKGLLISQPNNTVIVHDFVNLEIIDE